MNTPDALVAAFWEEWQSRFGNADQMRGIDIYDAVVQIARVSAKAAWEEGYTDGLDEALGDPDRPMARPENPYSTESYE